MGNTGNLLCIYGRITCCIGLLGGMTIDTAYAVIAPYCESGPLSHNLWSAILFHVMYACTVNML